MSGIEIDLGVVHHFSDGLYARQMMLPAGHYAVTHAHEYDHLSILATGRVLLEVDGVITDLTAPACVTVAAGKHHRITAMEDATWFCIHATDETDVDKLDEVLIGR